MKTKEETNEELKKWFWEKFNSCYYVTHKDYPKSLFMYYDEKFIRNIKLCKLSGKKITRPNKPSGICLFEQDYKNEYFFINYCEITSFLYENCSYEWLETKELIITWLKETEKMCILSPTLTLKWQISMLKLKETEKMCILSPIKYLSVSRLKETEKLSPVSQPFHISSWLKETEKMYTLSPIVSDVASTIWLNEKIEKIIK